MTRNRDGTRRTEGTGLDTSRPHPARRYDYWLGGKDNYTVDRVSGDQIAAVFPHIGTAARENRKFLHRVVHFLAAERGVRQFLDIGTGLPAAPHVHDIAAAAVPDARVVYVDNDPVVMVHARALMVASPPATTAYIEADLRDPDAICTDPVLRQLLDLTEPIGMLAVAVLHLLPDHDEPGAVLHRLIRSLPHGSYAAVSHATFDPLPPGTVAHLAALAGPGSPHGPFQARTRSELTEMLTGLTLVDPGLVPITDWRPDLRPYPDAAPAATFAETAMYAAVATCGA